MRNGEQLTQNLSVNYIRGLIAASNYFRAKRALAALRWLAHARETEIERAGWNSCCMNHADRDPINISIEAISRGLLKKNVMPFGN